MVTKTAETVTLDDAKEQVRRVCARMALLHLSFARAIIDELGEEKGSELILKAIKEYGKRIGEEVNKVVASQGLENTPENYREDLPAYGMHDGTETVEVNGERRIRAHGCVMGKVWHALGEGELGRYYCLVDPAKYMAYNPDYKLVHTKCLPDGDQYCELVLKRTTEREKEDFAGNDGDWRYIDR